METIGIDLANGQDYTVIKATHLVSEQNADKRHILDADFLREMLETYPGYKVTRNDDYGLVISGDERVFMRRFELVQQMRSVADFTSIPKRDCIEEHPTETSDQ